MADSWGAEPLSSRERRTLGVGPVASPHGTHLHGRYTILAELGTTRRPADSWERAHFVDPSEELLLVQYDLPATRPYHELTNPCHDAGTC